MATCPTCRAVYTDDQATCPADGADLLPDAAFAAADPDLEPGDTVGEYEIVGKVGQGGFGAVFEAVHPLIGKRVAIKVLKRAYSSDPETASRFIAEARAVNQIRHRYIIDVFSFGQLPDGRHYYMMDMLDGKPLDAFLEIHGRIPPENAIPILRAIAEAIDAAHAAGVTHRDLKPDNVFLTRDGAIKLLDFGIAKLVSGGSLHKTKTGAIMGTPLYMSPEQCRAVGVDHRTDIYSFGVIAFRMLTGELPFTAGDVMAILFKHMSDPAPTPSETAPELATAFDAPLLAMLEKAPEDRPDTLTAAVRAVEQAARTAGVAVSQTLPAMDLDAAAPPRAHGNVSGLDATISASDVAPETTDDAKMPPVAAAMTTSGLLGAESREIEAAPPRPRWLLGAAAAAIVVGVIAAVVLTRGGEDTRPAASAGDTSERADVASGDDAPGAERGTPGATAERATPGATAERGTPGATTERGKPGATTERGKPGATTERGKPGATVKPAADPPADAAPALPATVSITIEGAPAGARVLGPDRRSLGTAPGPITLPRGDAPISITVVRRGYRRARAKVIPSEDRAVEVAMRKLRKPKPPKPEPRKPRKPEPDPDSIPDNPF